MNVDADHKSNAFAMNRRLLWLAMGVVGAVFFVVAHDFQVSRYEAFIPWADAGAAREAGQNVLKGLALSSIGLLGAYLIVRRQGRALNATDSLSALMIFYLTWSTASVLWSNDPALSCRWLAVTMFCVLGAVGFARQFRPRDVALMAMVISGAYLLVGVGTEVTLGTLCPWSPGYRFAGTVHPNTQGMHLAVLCLASFCLAKSATCRQAWLWALFVVGLAFLLLTKSRASCAALAVALAALGCVNLSGRTRLMIAMSAAFLISAAALADALADVNIGDKIVRAAMLGRQEESEGLTGRIPIWTALQDYIAARPLQGYGYESFWTAQHIEAVSDEAQWSMREAHNTYIDAMLSVGLIGAATFLAVVLLSLRRASAAYRQTGDPGFAFTLCILIFGMVNACLESGMTAPNFTTFIAGSGIVQLLSLSSPQVAQSRSAVQGAARGRLCPNP
jgi:exopolysaccharide production protein ExoQ